MRLKTVAWVALHAPWWSRYAIAVPRATAARFGFAVGDDAVLIPAAHTRLAYVYGAAPRSTPLDELDAACRGALLNCVEPGESAQVRWEVVWDPALGLGVDVLGRFAYTARGTADEILMDYGPSFMASIADDKHRAAAKPPPRLFASASGGVFCTACAHFFTRRTFLGHLGASCKK